MQAGELRFSEWRDVVPDLHIVITDGWSVWSVCVCVCVCVLVKALRHEIVLMLAPGLL